LRVVVGFVAIEAVGLGKLVVEVRRIGGKCLLHVWGLVEGQDYTALLEAANTVELRSFQW
jgi:hypothetical protein